jgi:hypothetical protein
LTAILAMDELPKVVWLRVSPAKNEAQITYSTGRDADPRDFTLFTLDGKGKPLSETIKGMHVEVYLYEGLHEIAETLRANGGNNAR